MAEKGVFKRCGCTESVLDESGEPVLDGRGRPKRRELGSACPSLSKRAHGTWWFQCEVAPEPGSGKQRRRLRRGGFATKGDAEHVRNKIVGSERRGGDRHMPNDQLTTGEWLAQWIGARRNPRPATMRSYRGHIDNYLAPHLGHLRLTALRPHHIRAMFDKIEERNAEIEKALTANPRRTRGSKALPDEVRESRRVCGPASQQRIRATLRKALNDAMGQGLITTNAAVHVEMASGQAPRALIWTPQRVAEWRATGVVPSRVMVWRPDQCGEFLDYARDDRLYRLFPLIAVCGLRRGEACGLRWRDVDLATGVARIEVQLTQNGWEVAEGEPKSDTGRRPIMLPAETVAELKAHRKEQAAERLKWGSAWIDSGRVFVREGGEHLVPDTLSERFRVLAAEAGLPPITLHGLRHGAATYALDAGVDIRVVQEMLGHSSSVLTRDTYTSVSERLQQDAAERVSSIIPRAAATGTAPRGSAR